jgi:hypothetical protein
MRPYLLLTAMLACGLLTASRNVSAQTRDENYGYRFEDDALLGDTLTTPPPLLKLRQKGRHVMLIRPRVSFVSELATSIEKL